MVNIDEIRKHQRTFLNQVKERKKPTIYTIKNIEIKVNPGVFPPATDTKLLAANIYAKPGERTLDLTTGAGIFSIIAGRQGATGIAVDINPLAVVNANENFLMHHVQMRAIQSNLFKNVPPERFDQIYANGPFFEGTIIDPLDYACYGAKTFIEGLFKGLRSRLRKGGKLLVVMSAWSDLKHFKDTAKEHVLVTKLITTRNSDDGVRTYNLYEVSVA